MSNAILSRSAALAGTFACAALCSATGWAAEIHVPADAPTIQSAIDLALPGDTVLVAPGTYVENIDFLGKDITVRSEQGPAVTIIDGGGIGSVVLMGSGEGPDAVLRGFTIRNGYSDFDGGGILIGGGAPTVIGNVVTGNTACNGAGIAVSFSSATIRGNRIVGNYKSGCSGGNGGGGILIIGAASARILNNYIADNSSSAGGAISMFAAGTPAIMGNRMLRNAASGEGGAIWMVNQSDANIVQNLIVGNVAGGQGGGIWWLVPSGARGPALVNNTIAYNRSGAGGSAVFADGFDVNARLTNNVMVGAPGDTVVLCGDFNDLNEPRFTANDVYTTSGSTWGGICTDHTGLDGNVSSDPEFVDPAAGNLRLMPTSACIDAGAELAVLPARDLDGNPRVTDGDGDGFAIVDMGAYERAPPALSD